MELTGKQQLFVLEYIKDFNATQAAIRAGYAKSGARVQGVRLLANANIQNQIRLASKAVLQRVEVEVDDIAQELAQIGFADMGNYIRIDDDGRIFLDFSAIKGGATRVIGEITQEEYVEGKGEDCRLVKKTKFKLHDKLSALEKLARWVGMFDGGKVPVNAADTQAVEGEFTVDGDAECQRRALALWLEAQSDAGLGIDEVITLLKGSDEAKIEEAPG